MPSNPTLLQAVQQNLRLRQASPRTEEAYLQWIRRFIRFHRPRHPRELGVVEIRVFLTHLAVEGRMASATVAQARAALLFLYRQVLGLELEGVDGLPRGRRPVRLRWS